MVSLARAFVLASFVFPFASLFAAPMRLPWNSRSQEFGASLSDRGNLYFYSNRGGSGTDLYCSRKVNGVFEPPELLKELNSSFDDQSPFILGDESGIIFSSNRDGSHEFRTARGIAVSRDLYYARHTEAGWDEPEIMPETINTDLIEENPFLYGKRLFFVRYPFGKPELAHIYYSDLTESGWSESRPLFSFSAITPGVFRGRFFFATRAQSGKYQIQSIPLDQILSPDAKNLMRAEPGLDPQSDEASYAESRDGTVVFARRSPTGDYDLFSLNQDPWESSENFSLTSILFESSRSDVLPESSPILDRLAEYLKRTQAKVFVTGHTDRTGDPQANLQLSRDRALAVKRELVNRGVSPDRVKTDGKGQTEPVDPGETEEAYAKNRRTEFKILRD